MSRRSRLPVLWALELAGAIADQAGSRRPPATDDELWQFVHDHFGESLVRDVHPDCVARGHVAPFTAFADAYFARVPLVLWIGSRGLAGKTYLLGLLIATEVATLGAGVSLFGGSREQAVIAFDYARRFWERDTGGALPAARWQARGVAVANGGDLKVHATSRRSARGQHRPRLRIDEADEFELEKLNRERIRVLDDALGQPLPQGEVAAQIVIASTWHRADGPVTLLRQRLESGELVGQIQEWCYRESLQRVVDGVAVGWLEEGTVERKRGDLTREQFRVEVELQEPTAEDRAIDRDAVDRMWDVSFCEVKDGVPRPQQGDLGEYIEWPCCRDYDPAAGPHSWHRYATGCDWGRRRDLTAIVTYRTDVDDGFWWLVAWEVDRGRNWDHLAERFNWRVERFPGPAAHDATGMGGDVLHESSLIRVPATPVQLTGGPTGRRTRLFTEYVLAIEQAKFLGPRIERAWRDHRGVTRNDLWGSGHPPDSFVAGALAWSLRRESALLDLDLGVDRLSGPGPLAGLR